jgi:hypothetical protein
MIAKKTQLIINVLGDSSLQGSLQSCQLSTLTSLQVQEVLYSVCKEKKLIVKELQNLLCRLVCKTILPNAEKWLLEF